MKLNMLIGLIGASGTCCSELQVVSVQAPVEIEHVITPGVSMGNNYPKRRNPFCIENQKLMDDLDRDTHAKELKKCCTLEAIGACGDQCFAFIIWCGKDLMVDAHEEAKLSELWTIVGIGKNYIEIKHRNGDIHRVEKKEERVYE